VIDIISLCLVIILQAMMVAEKWGCISRFIIIPTQLLASLGFGQQLGFRQQALKPSKH
jgi:hypothetical protein